MKVIQMMLSLYLLGSFAYAAGEDIIYIPPASFSDTTKGCYVVISQNSYVTGMKFNKNTMTFYALHKDSNKRSIDKINVRDFVWQIPSDKLDTYIQNLAFQLREFGGEYSLRAYCPALGGGGAISSEIAKEDAALNEQKRLIRAIMRSYKDRATNLNQCQLGELNKSICYIETQLDIQHSTKITDLANKLSRSSGELMGKITALCTEGLFIGIADSHKKLQDNLYNLMTSINPQEVNGQEEIDLQMIQILEQYSQSRKITSFLESLGGIIPAIVSEPRSLEDILPTFAQSGTGIANLANKAILYIQRIIASTNTGIPMYEESLCIIRQVQELAMRAAVITDAREEMKIINQISELVDTVDTIVRSSIVIISTLKATVAISKQALSSITLKGAALAGGGYAIGRLAEYGVEQTAESIAQHCGWDEEKAGMIGQGVFFGAATGAYAFGLYKDCKNPLIMKPLRGYVVGRSIEFIIDEAQYMAKVYDNTFTQTVNEKRAKFQEVYIKSFKYGYNLYTSDPTMLTFEHLDEQGKIDYNSAVLKGRGFFDRLLREDLDDIDAHDRAKNALSSLVDIQITDLCSSELEKFFDTNKK